MNETLLLPYYYSSKESELLLTLEDGSLTLHKSRSQGNWESQEVLHDQVKCFTAAPSLDDAIHVVAADNDGALHYFIITKEKQLQLPFILTKSLPFFGLAFTKNRGYFFAKRERRGELAAAVFDSKKGWEAFPFKTKLTDPAPLSLAVSAAGDIHLLAYDFANGNLCYLHRPEESGRWENPFVLGTKLRYSPAPALHVDIHHSLLCAWFVPDRNAIRFRVKLPGGWPHGGWREEQESEAAVSPRFLSFAEVDGRQLPWYIGPDNKPYVCGEPAPGETGHNTPVRQALPAHPTLNMSDALPPVSWLFTSIADAGTARKKSEHELPEQEDQLLIHAHKMAEERRKMEQMLYQRETALAQYRQMLERVQESHQQQKRLANEKISSLKKNNDTLLAENKLLTQKVKILAEEREKIAVQIAQFKRERTELLKEMDLLQDNLCGWQSKARLLEEERHRLTDKKSIWKALSDKIQNIP